MFYLNRKIDFEKRRRVGGGMGVVVVRGAKETGRRIQSFLLSKQTMRLNFNFLFLI